LKPASSDFAQIPRGSTCPGVHAFVLKLLLASQKSLGQGALLDIPCGKTEFLTTLKQFLPQWQLSGADLFVPPHSEGHAFHQIDAANGFSIEGQPLFDCITCISGVMEFDNTLQFFKDCNRHLHAHGTLIVSNDNHLSVYDRLSYLLLGSFRRPYRIFVAPGQTTWKVIPINNLCRILSDSGFEVTNVHYMSTSPKDLLLGFLFGPLLYGIQLIYRVTDKSSRRSTIPAHLRSKLYPFKSYFCRHYVVECKKAL
jgi:hypothetical protein